MLRKVSLATSALILCAALAHAGQTGVMPKGRKAMAFGNVQVGHAFNGIPVTVTTSKQGTQSTHNVLPNLNGAVFSNYNKDANAQFLSWYGYAISNHSSCHSYSSGWHSCIHSQTSNAFPFKPATTMTTKKVTVPVFSDEPSAQYQVDIYSSLGGVPGKVIAVSKAFTAGDTKFCCSVSRTVVIKANLVAGAQYFIGVTGVCCNDANGGWALEDTDLSGDAIDYEQHFVQGTYGSTTNQHYTYTASSGAWRESTFIPETGAAIVK